MRYYRIILFFVVLNCQFVCVYGQRARIVFYNVENLFDIADDSLTRDEEFLPDGVKSWTYERFHAKLVRIYKTLAAIGEGEIPVLVGLCEIENRMVLNRLIYETPLVAGNYRIIHRDSRDARGVDVALVYREELFFADTAEWLTVPLGPGETTREILHVKGRLWGKDTLDIFINHWPSRFGGAGSSAMKRLSAAATLAVSVKEVLLRNPAANVIIMGDFNDEPGDESILSINKILDNTFNTSELMLTNLSYDRQVTSKIGTIKHQGSWSIFDQVLVSPALLRGTNGCLLTGEKAEIFGADFLLEPDETYSGFKPFRTYTGPGYHNGFSDHLPVSVVIEKVR